MSLRCFFGLHHWVPTERNLRVRAEHASKTHIPIEETFLAMELECWRCGQLKQPWKDLEIGEAAPF